MATPLRLSVVEAKLAVVRLPPGVDAPDWINGPGALTSITRTFEELSIVCRSDVVPEGLPAEGPWCAIKVQGPIPMTLIGVIAAIASPLADAGIAIFAISTFDTDYVLVHEPDLETAIEVLERAGHEVAR
jgi:hypothetical protein